MPVPDPPAKPDVAVIGGGIAGLTAAALLARAGAAVTLFEAHNVAGGCAAFYQRAGYRFDVGATLLGGFGERGVHRRVFRHLGIECAAERLDPAMLVHVPGECVQRFGDERWIAERRRAFGVASEPFWLAQERLADAAWDFAGRLPALPVDLSSALRTAGALRARHWPLIAAAGAQLRTILPARVPRALQTFINAQLLITAQTDGADADLVYAATALDLAREGTYHVAGGPGTIARLLALAVRRNGSRIAYRSAVAAIVRRRGRVAGVRLQDGSFVGARSVVSALPLHDTAALLEGPHPLGRRVARLPQHWGAFMLYAALRPGAVADDFPLHHQIVSDDALPLGEGNSVFVSLSAAGERGRAPGGGRALTISTHTGVGRWERAAAAGELPALRARYQTRLLDALERIVPGARAHMEFVEAATPLTFARYTGRFRGLVGGVPQTASLAGLRSPGHASGVAGLVLCGDTIFPGQSTVGTTLSGINAARAIAARSGPP